MSLNPSNGISEQTTGRKPFQNVADMGKDDPQGVDAILEDELKSAGIKITRLPEFMRESSGGEPRSCIAGSLHGWSFRRAWYYWIAKGPGIPPRDAMDLHKAHGKSVRVEGHLQCPSPAEYLHGFAVGSYHVDNADGLAALAATIERIFTQAAQ